MGELLQLYSEPIQKDPVQIYTMSYESGLMSMLEAYRAQVRMSTQLGDEAVFQSNLDAGYARFPYLMELGNGQNGETAGMLRLFRQSLLYPQDMHPIPESSLVGHWAFSVDRTLVTVAPLGIAVRQQAPGCPDMLVQSVVLVGAEMQAHDRPVVPWRIDPIILVPDDETRSVYVDKYASIFRTLAEGVFGVQEMKKRTPIRLTRACGELADRLTRKFQTAINYHNAFSDIIAASALSPLVAYHSLIASPGVGASYTPY